MATVTIRLNDDDKKLFEKYAEFEGKNLTGFIRDSIFEKIEDEYDYKLAEIAHKEWEADNFEKISFEKVKEEYGI